MTQRVYNIRIIYKLWFVFILFIAYNINMLLRESEVHGNTEILL